MHLDENALIADVAGCAVEVTEVEAFADCPSGPSSNG